MTSPDLDEPAEGPQDAESPSPLPSADPLIGRVIDDRYRIISLVDHGGMASVYRAHDERLDRTVALKIIHPHLAGSSLLMTRFLREARSAAKVSHPQIVPIYDQGVFEARPYLVMELVPGMNLRSLLNSQGSLTVGLALSFTEQIFDAISAAHAADLVHRDLKPENVLVTPDGSLKIVDFGLVRAKKDESLTLPDSLIGTMAYLAPESALPGQVDERADIYSAGLMLYEMLTGELPWEEVTPTQVAFAHVHQDVPPPSAKVPWLPPEIDRLVAGLCARSFADRVPSAAEALKLVDQTRGAVDPQLLNRRSAHLPESGPDREKPTEVLHPARTEQTAILPISPQIVHTSGSADRAAPKARKKQAAPLPLVILIGVLLISGLPAATWWWVQYGPGSYQTVPDVVSLSKVDAEAALSTNLISYTTTQEFSEDVVEDHVIRTAPSAGNRVHKNDTVKLVISKGPQMVVVPDVVGLTQEEATAALAAAGLQVGEASEAWSDTRAAGTVIASFPSGGREARMDSEVSVQVSKGKRPVEVPSVVGMRSEEAVAALTAAELKPEVSREFSREVPEGNVISQQPTAADGALAVGETVKVVVSQGPELIEVPDVRGLAEESAKKVLQDEGFEVKVNRSYGLFSLVSKQDPEAGANAEAGSTVAITVR